MRNEETHVPVLDGVRGLAITMVLIYHFVGEVPFSQAAAARMMHGVVQSLWIGVDLFFVLSGFLITGILYDTRHSNNFFKTFYARRFLRIFPLYYGFLFLVILLTKPLQMDWAGREFLYLAYIQNTGVMLHVFSRPLSPLMGMNHLWSLAVEEQFYFVWPGLVYLFKDRKRLMLCAGALVGASIALRLAMLAMNMSRGAIYTFTPTRADALMIGAMLALAMRSSPETQAKVIRAAWVALPCGVTALVALAWPLGCLSWQSYGVSSIGYTVTALTSAALIALSLRTRVFRRMFDWQWLRSLGKYSYGIYVLHYPVLTLFGHLSVPAWMGKELGPWGAHVLVVATAAAASLGLAVLSYRFYESRFLRLKKYFRYRFDFTRNDTVAVEAVQQ